MYVRLRAYDRYGRRIAPSAVGPPFWMLWRSLSPELHDAIVDCLDLGTLAVYADVFPEQGHRNLRERVTRALDRHHLAFDSTMALFRRTDTRMAGSVCNKIMDDGGWHNRDLDWYTPVDQVPEVVAYLETHGYGAPLIEHPHAVPFDPQASPQPYERQGAVNEILALHHGASGAKINVMQSSTKSSVAPIVAFHSTVVMNWVSYDGITCCYPSLTFQLQGLSNVLPTFKTAKKALALQKYQDRGYQIYESCTQLNHHTVRACEEERPRNIRLPDGMYLGTNACNPYCKRRVRKVNDGEELSMSFFPETTVEDHKYRVAWRLARVLEGSEAERLRRMYPTSPRVLERKGWISVDKLMIYQEAPKNVAMASSAV